jgi:hypothetical protein
MLSEEHKLDLKLCHKWCKEIDLLHLIVVPQLGGGKQHNYSTKTSSLALPMSSLCILSCLWAKRSKDEQSFGQFFSPENDTNRHCAKTTDTK